jgi:hypothetical protein
MNCPKCRGEMQQGRLASSSTQSEVPTCGLYVSVRVMRLP